MFHSSGALRRLPSVDQVLKAEAALAAISRYGRSATVEAMRDALGEMRAAARACGRRGAERGDPDGQAMLGAAYHLGAGVPRDALAAYVWLLRACTGRSPLAATFLEPVCAALSPDEIAEAEHRAAAPFPEPPP